MKKNLIAAAAVALLATSAAFAQGVDTLAKIKSAGVVNLGVRESSGLGYTLGGGKYVGFHTEMAERIIDDLKKQLGTPALKTVYQPITSQNRIPLLQNGTIDFECGSTTNNRARQKDADFAVTTFVEEVRIAVKADSGITCATAGCAAPTMCPNWPRCSRPGRCWPPSARCFMAARPRC